MLGDLSQVVPTDEINGHAVVLVLLETFHLLYVKYQPTGTHNCLHTIQNMTQMTFPIIPCNQTFDLL